MLEVYQKVFITLAIGFAITGAALFIARKLAVFIDKKRGIQPGNHATVEKEVEKEDQFD